VSGQTEWPGVTGPEQIAEMLQAFVDERRALEDDRDYWRSRALKAEAEVAEQRAIDRSAPNRGGSELQGPRRRWRGNWLDNR
jgi:hypothetical protein